MKDLIISYNDEKGFYCEDICDKLFFHKVLLKLVDKYNLKTYNFGENMLVSDIEIYFTIKELNQNKYNIELREEDGSEWVFG